MIERHWKGTTHGHEAQHYVTHLLNDTFPKLQSIAGFKGSSILKRRVAEGVEFLIITRWESLEAIRQFAGESMTTAVVPDVARKMMHHYDAEAVHFEVEYAVDV